MSIPEIETSNRLFDILDAMSGGMSREEVAEMYGHKDKASVDQYMRRQGYVWDRVRQTYVRKDSATAMHGRVSSSRAIDVIAQFRKPGADAREIAKRLRFTNHHEMARYMQARGYHWDAAMGNYVSTAQEQAEDVEKLEDAATEGPVAQGARGPALPSIDWGKFVPLLMRLQKHEDKLLSLLTQAATETAEVPRYAMPGVFTVKSIHMSVSLDQLVKEFSREKNISQREIFEVALVQFLKKYGYEREVEALLSR